MLEPPNLDYQHQEGYQFPPKYTFYFLYIFFFDSWAASLEGWLSLCKGEVKFKFFLKQFSLQISLKHHPPQKKRKEKKPSEMFEIVHHFVTITEFLSFHCLYSLWWTSKRIRQIMIDNIIRVHDGVIWNYHTKNDFLRFALCVSGQTFITIKGNTSNMFDFDRIPKIENIDSLEFQHTEMMIHEVQSVRRIKCSGMIPIGLASRIQEKPYVQTIELDECVNTSKETVSFLSNFSKLQTLKLKQVSDHVQAPVTEYETQKSIIPISKLEICNWRCFLNFGILHAIRNTERNNKNKRQKTFLKLVILDDPMYYRHQGWMATDFHDESVVDALPRALSILAPNTIDIDITSLPRPYLSFDLWATACLSVEIFVFRYSNMTQYLNGDRNIFLNHVARIVEKVDQNGQFTKFVGHFSAGDITLNDLGRYQDSLLSRQTDAIQQIILDSIVWDFVYISWTCSAAATEDYIQMIDFWISVNNGWKEYMDDSAGCIPGCHRFCFTSEFYVLPGPCFSEMLCCIMDLFAEDGDYFIYDESDDEEEQQEGIQIEFQYEKHKAHPGCE